MTMSRDRKVAKVGAWIALVLSIAPVLRVIAIDNAEALVIVAPASVGALLVLAWSQRCGNADQHEGCQQTARICREA